MSFGFDPSIILASKQYAGPDANETARTLAQLAGVSQQNELRRATLAEMMRKGQRGQSVADAQIAANQARGNESKIGYVLKNLELIARPLQKGAPKNQEEYDTLRAAWKAAGVPDEMLAGHETLDPQTAQVLEQFRSMGTKPDEIKPVEQARMDLTASEAEKKRAFDAEQRRLDREARALAADAARAKKGEAAETKKTEGAKLLTIDGYDLDPGFTVKPEVAEKLRDAQAQSRLMVQNVDELMSLYKKHGNQVLPGASRARMEAVAKHLQLKSKGDVMFKLGVIAGPDMDILNAVVPVPTGKQATIADFFSGSRDVSETMERLRVMREQVDGNFHSAASSRGYKKKGAGAASGRRSAAEIRAELEALK